MKAKVVITEELLKRGVFYFYIACNAYALYVAVVNGVLLGDFHQTPAPAPMICVALFALVVLSYRITLVTIFDALMRKSAKLLSQRWSGNIYSDVFVIALQLVHLWISIDLTLAVAGMYSTPSSMLKYYVYFIPVEYIVLIYVTVRANLNSALSVSGIYILSGLLRGWSGGIIILGLVLAVRLCNSRTAVSVWNIVSIAVAALIFSPVIFVLRALVRQQLGTFERAVAYVTEISGNASVWQYVFSEFVARFQHLSSFIVVFERREELHSLFYGGSIRLFLFDGNYGQAVLAALGIRPLELGQIMTKVVLGVDPTAVAYNVHTGLLSWFFVAPELSLLYIAYITALCLLNAALIWMAGFDRRVVLLSWTMWVLLLMNGWFGAFVSYLFALFCFAAVRVFQATVKATMNFQKKVSPKVASQLSP